MAIKVIAQLRELKIGKNPGKKFVMRPDLYSAIAEKKVFQEGCYPQRNFFGCNQGCLGCSR